MKKILLFFTIFLVFLTFLSIFCFINHKSESFEQTSFVLDTPYLSVVQNLAKKDALEQIVKENDAQLSEKSWENFDIDVPNRLLRIKEYKISGILHFVVEKNDNFLGKLVIPFTQIINFDKNMLKIDIKLEDTQEKILFYEKSIKITPILKENKTFFEINSKITIKNKIFFFFKNFMDEKVVENNKKDIEQLEKNLKKITKKPKLNIVR